MSICKNCLEELRQELLHKVSSNGYRVTRVAICPSSQLVFSNNFFSLYISSEIEILKGKRKGEIKKVENQHYFKSNFCPRCGNKVDGDK